LEDEDLGINKRPNPCTDIQKNRLGIPNTGTSETKKARKEKFLPHFQDSFTYGIK
jgi:hypothetical protein